MIRDGSINVLYSGRLISTVGYIVNDSLTKDVSMSFTADVSFLHTEEGQESDSDTCINVLYSGRLISTIKT